MPTKPFLIDPREYDLDRPLYGIEAIRNYLEHRHEMEQLSGVLRLDPEARIIVGFKRYGQDEFWVRGHIPGRPILPGVLMIEAAAQLGTFWAKLAQPEKRGFWALAAVDEVRFRGSVGPGEALLIAGHITEIRSRFMRLEFQGFLAEKQVVEGTLTGMLV